MVASGAGRNQAYFLPATWWWRGNLMAFDVSMSMIGLHPKGPFSRVVLFLMTFGSTVERLSEVEALIKWVLDQGKSLGHMLGSVRASHIEWFVVSLFIPAIEDESGWY
jgi:hypothetical protein